MRSDCSCRLTALLKELRSLYPLSVQATFSREKGRQGQQFLVFLTAVQQLTCLKFWCIKMSCVFLISFSVSTFKCYIRCWPTLLDDCHLFSIFPSDERRCYDLICSTKHSVTSITQKQIMEFYGIWLFESDALLCTHWRTLITWSQSYLNVSQLLLLT